MTKKIKLPAMYVGGRKFIQLPELAFDVRQGRAGDVVFPTGTKNVWCSFRTGRMVLIKGVGPVKLNVYMKNGITAHA